MTGTPLGDPRRVMSWISRALRAAVVAAGALVLLAIAVAALERRRPSAGPAAVPSPASPLVRVAGVGAASDLFLDAEGTPVAVAHPDGRVLQRAGWSPPGRPGAEVVGVLIPVAGRGGPVLLARIAQPSGEVLDQVPFDELPNWSGSPCWYPDGSALVLLAGNDNRLVGLAFAPRRGDPPRLTALPWDAGPPGGAPYQIRDLSWPGGDALGGLILASIKTRIGAPGTGETPDKDRAWWIRLDEGQSRVEEAAGLIRRGPGEPPELEERFPTLIRRDGGPPLLAWLERNPAAAQAGWRLRAGRVEIGEGRGEPYVTAESAVTLADGCALAAPAPGGEGAWIAYVPAAPGPPRVRIVPLERDRD